MRNLGYVLTTCLALMIVVGCGSTPIDTNFQPRVVISQDNIQFQASGIRRTTQTLTYQWQNSGTAASIDQTSSVSMGSAKINLLDASNTMVYSGDLKTDGTFTSTAGTAGQWTMQIVLSNVTGSLNFHAQKM